MEKKIAGGETIIINSITTELIFSGIFSRLPIKSVIQCKAVCKAWYNLLKHPDFTTNYEKNPPFTTLLFPGISTGRRRRQTTFYLLEIPNNNRRGGSGSCIQTPIKMPDPDPSSTCILQLEGSCNALVCLSSRQPYHPHGIEEIYICNPITGDVIQLPPLNKYYSHYFFLEGGVVRSICRFGYIISAYQYKVLRILIYKSGFNHRSAAAAAAVEILTIGIDGAWRRLPASISTNFTSHKSGTILNGVYHWISAGDNSMTMVYTMDLGEETMGTNIFPPPPPPPPPLIGIGRNRNLIMEVLDSYHCIGDCSQFCKITLWIMKEYGIAESWTEYVTLGCHFSISPVITLKLDDGGDEDILLFSHFRVLRRRVISHTVISVGIEQKKRSELKALQTEVPFEKGDHCYIGHAINYSPCFSSQVK